MLAIRTFDLDREEGLMIRFTSLTMAAAAVVIGVHSGSLALALAALCGACGVASFADDVASSQ